MGEIRKKQSDFLMDSTFTRDVAYKKVYILTPDGWIFTDAKYQTHTAQSIAKDAVDYYLQFRPSVHFPIGSYVIVPDDTSSEINLTDSELKNPFTQPVKKRSQWWMIVGRDNTNAFVRYNILQCNWNFQWVYNGEIQSCFGAARNANSYTSGKWSDSMSSSLDDLNGAWLPDTYYVYGENLAKLGLSDTRTIKHEQRFMLTNNLLDPKVYQVTKILELFPQGIIKMSMKQDELNLDRDNVELRICDFYTDSGDIAAISGDLELFDADVTISQYIVDKDNMLSEADTTSNQVKIGASSYYKVNISNDNIEPVWNIELLDPNDEYSDKQRSYYCGLMKMSMYNRHTVMIKPGKASSLIGKTFRLYVDDLTGNRYSSIDLEVIA